MTAVQTVPCVMMIATTWSITCLATTSTLLTMFKCIFFMEYTTFILTSLYKIVTIFHLLVLVIQSAYSV